MLLTQQYRGWAPYRSDLRVPPHRLLVAVSCFVGGASSLTDCLLDTAAEWCVLPAEMVPLLASEPAESLSARLESRFGFFSGHLERVPVRFPAAEGESLTIEATFFVSAEWPGPLVLGWKGCLERFRFAVDPHEERFYFGTW